MKQILLRSVSFLLVLISASSCIDNKYDLSDIDSTSKLKVKDLVVPIDVDVISLGDIFNIKEEDKIQEITLNGEKFYAINKSGAFHSDRFNVPSFSSSAQTLSDEVLSFPIGDGSLSAGNSITIPLTHLIKKDIVYKVEGIDPAIVSLEDIYTEKLTFTISFDAQNIPSDVNLSLNDIVLAIPKGLDLDPSGLDFKYNSFTGRYSLSSLPFKNGSAQLTIAVNKVNLPANGCRLSDQSFALSSCLNIERADLAISSNSNNRSIPANIKIKASYSLSDMKATAVTGYIEYVFDGKGMDIPSIDLSVIPDFLAGSGTNLILANPQIYLSVNNPLTALGLDLTSGFQVTAIRKNQASKSYSLDYGHIGVDHSKPVGARYEFRLSPELNKDQILIPSGYENPEQVYFSSLREVLTGDGIPEMLDIELFEPKIFRQHIDKLLLDTEFPALEGDWEFIAPLALTNIGDEKSRIIYTKTDRGWHKTRLYDMTIESLELSMNVDNDLPLESTLTGYPVDINGRQIGNVTIEGAVIPANAKNQEVKLYITGEVSKLDGISFTASVIPVSEKPLSSSQTIKLKDLKAKVSGYYIKKL